MYPAKLCGCKEADESWTDILKLFGYQLKEMIGKGSYGKVYKAYDEENEKIVAMKFCTKQTKGEMEYWTQIDHPRIIQLHDIICVGEKTIYIMEMAENGTLCRFSRQRSRVKRSLLMKWFWQTIQLMADLHAMGYYHLDLKLNNLFIDSNWDLKIGDFGRMCVCGDLDYVIGAPGYRPPELKKFHGFRRMRAGMWMQKVDVYFLGACFLRLTTKRPVWGRRIHRILPLVSDAEIHAILSKMLKNNPEDRYSFQQLLDHREQFRRKHKPKIHYSCNMRSQRIWSWLFGQRKKRVSSSSLSTFRTSQTSFRMASSNDSYLATVTPRSEGSTYRSDDHPQIPLKHSFFPFPKHMTTFPVVNYWQARFALPFYNVYELD